MSSALRGAKSSKSINVKLRVVVGATVCEVAVVGAALSWACAMQDRAIAKAVREAARERLLAPRSGVIIQAERLFERSFHANRPTLDSRTFKVQGRLHDVRIYCPKCEGVSGLALPIRSIIRADSMYRY
jgi:hypothetical protein